MRHYGLHIFYYESPTKIQLLPRHYTLTYKTTHHPRARTIIKTTDGSQQLPFTTDKVLPPPQRRPQNIRMPTRLVHSENVSIHTNLSMCVQSADEAVQIPCQFVFSHYQTDKDHIKHNFHYMKPEHG